MADADELKIDMIAAAVVCDWGTSSLRCYLVDASGHIRAERSNGDGLLAMGERSYPQVLEDLIGDWLQTKLPVLLCGMVGSAKGWHEVPYVPCPSSAADLAAGMQAIEWGAGRKGWIVPGVSHQLGTLCEVMRGEETQVVGYLHLNGVQDALVCLPGTHSKYVQVRDGLITDLRTYMTGELFALLRTHSILGGTLDDSGVGAGADVPAFKRGVDHTGMTGGLLHHIFQTRTQVLLKSMQRSESASFLSGVLIGHELRGADPREPVILIGRPDLVQMYRHAFDRLGLPCSVAPAVPAVAGAFRLGQLAGVIDD